LNLGILHIDHIMPPLVPYPAKHGFLQTLGEDSDPIDATVLMQNRPSR
jgi:inorganic pyrophosphatase